MSAQLCVAQGSHSSIGPIPDRWCATRTDAFDSAQDPEDSPYPTPSRDDQYLNDWLRCPATEIGGYRILRSGSIVGYFLLSRVGGQTWISDIRLHSAGPAEWIIAYRLAARSAGRASRHVRSSRHGVDTVREQVARRQRIPSSRERNSSSCTILTRNSPAHLLFSEHVTTMLHIYENLTTRTSPDSGEVYAWSSSRRLGTFAAV